MTVKILGTAEDLLSAREDMRRLPFNRWFIFCAGTLPEYVGQHDLYDETLVRRDAHHKDDAYSVIMTSEDGKRWDWAMYSDLKVYEEAP